MKTSNNNGLRRGASLSLYVTSYMPLFLIVIIKQLNDNSEFLHWAGFKREAIVSFLSHFGMSFLLACVSIIGLIGIAVLLNNFNKSLRCGYVVTIKKIGNRNNESIGYIATYIVPFFASDFSSLLECCIFFIVMVLIYMIYVNSNMILINPLLSLKYSLLEIEYSLVGDVSNATHDALIITETKDYKENVNYDIYQIGFKLYYGKERRKD